MVVEMNYNYDTKHKSNILMAGTGCRKTTFLKNFDEFDDLLEHIQNRKPRCNEKKIGIKYRS